MWSAKAKAKIDIPLGNNTVKKNSEITITKGRNYEYAIWHHSGIYDLPGEYVKDVEEVTNEINKII